MPTSPPTVGIVGGGSIGVGWTIAFARAGFDVVVLEPDADRRRLAPAELSARLGALSVFGLLEEDPSVVLARTRITPHLDQAVEGAVHIQECVPESLELKVKTRNRAHRARSMKPVQ